MKQSHKERWVPLSDEQLAMQIRARTWDVRSAQENLASSQSMLDSMRKELRRRKSASKEGVA